MREKTECFVKQLRGSHCPETCCHKRHTNRECEENDIEPNSSENKNGMSPKYDDFLKLIHEIDEIEEVVPNLDDNIENDENNANCITESNGISNKYTIEHNNDPSDFVDENIDAIVEKRFDEIIVENVPAIKVKHENLNTEDAIYSEEEISRAIDSIVKNEAEENNFEETPACDGFIERIECTDFGKTSRINGGLDDFSAETSYKAPDDSLINANASQELRFQKTLAEASVVEIEIIQIPEEYRSLNELFNCDRSNDHLEVLEEKDNLIKSNDNIVREENSNSENTLQIKFKCDLENKKLSKEQVTTKHRMKSIKCSLCEYTATQPYKLKAHMLRHTGEKPFKCNLCDYACARKDALKRHYLKHTGEKPFNCQNCDSKFSCLKYLNRHRKHYCPVSKYENI